MENSSVVDKLIDRITGAMPADANVLRDDFNRAVRLAVSSGLARMELVTREEFEVQAELLQRTRSRLEGLEERVRELEQAADSRAGGVAP